MNPTAQGGLPEHRSEHQAPRRSTRTIIPNAIAEPPSERSVFGELARRRLRNRRLADERGKHVAYLGRLQRHRDGFAMIVHLGEPRQFRLRGIEE